MRLLIDTSVLIDHLRGDPRALTLLIQAAQAGDELWGATAIRAEVLAGMRPREERTTLTLLNALHWQDLTIDLADRAGALARRYRGSHSNVDTIDYVIAATAEHLGATLLTQNVRHFPMFPGLKPAYAHRAS